MLRGCGDSDLGSVGGSRSCDAPSRRGGSGTACGLYCGLGAAPRPGRPTYPVRCDLIYAFPTGGDSDPSREKRRLGRLWSSLQTPNTREPDRAGTVEGENRPRGRTHSGGPCVSREAAPRARLGSDDRLALRESRASARALRPGKAPERRESGQQARRARLPGRGHLRAPALQLPKFRAAPGSKRPLGGTFHPSHNRLDSGWERAGGLSEHAAGGRPEGSGPSSPVSLFGATLCPFRS